MKKNRSVNSQGTAKPAKAGPVGADPLHLPLKRGRPKGSLNKKHNLQPLSETPLEEVKASKVTKIFQRAIADQEIANALPEFDGGGTPSNAVTITKESLERRVARRLNVLDRYLTDDKLFALLQLSSLKEIGIYEGIMMDKSLVLKGQPTVIIGNEDRKAMDEVMPRLLTELKKRGLITSVSERKIEFKNT
jgi:hypothetical protein